MDAPTRDPLAGQRRHARSLAVRDALLDAAARTLAAQGYGGAAVADIAAAAGLSKNHIFQHFGSKEALAQAALERVMASWRGNVAQAAQIFPQPERQLAHAAQALATLQAQGWAGLGCLAALAQNRSTLPDALRQALDAALDEFAGFFRDLMKDTRKAGRLTLDAKPRQLGLLFAAGLLGAAAAGADASEQLLLLRGLFYGAAAT